MMVFFDIDDTLLKDNSYPNNYNEIIKLIDELKLKGVSFGISTNRSLDKTVKSIIKDYHIDRYIMCEGGACIYKKEIIYYRLLNKDKISINKITKDLIEEYLNKNNMNVKVKITKNKTNESIIINKNRINSSSIKVPSKIDINNLIKYLEKSKKLNKMIVSKDYNHNNKIHITYKNINKVTGIKKFFNKKKVILITDYEKKLSFGNKYIKVYSVGLNHEFNKKCNMTYPLYGDGVQKILENIRSELK